MYTQRCAYCGEYFQSPYSTKIFCSAACRKADRSVSHQTSATKGKGDRHEWMNARQYKEWLEMQRHLKARDEMYKDNKKPTKGHWRSKPSHNPMPYGEIR